MSLLAPSQCHDVEAHGCKHEEDSHRDSAVPVSSKAHSGCAKGLPKKETGHAQWKKGRPKKITYLIMQSYDAQNIVLLVTDKSKFRSQCLLFKVDPLTIIRFVSRAFIKQSPVPCWIKADKVCVP